MGSSAPKMEKYKTAAHGFLADKRFSDFTIVCGGKEFKVHRIIISSHSEFFERCCTGGFTEARGSGKKKRKRESADRHQAETRRVELKDDLPLAVERMIEFFYKVDYDDSVGPPSGKTKFSAQLHAYIYALGDKYDAPDLKAAALRKFQNEIYQVARPEPHVLFEAARTVYNNIELPDGDRALHRAIVNLLVIAGKDVFARYQKENPLENLENLAEEIPMLFADLSMCFMGAVRDIPRSCYSCGHVAPVTVRTAADPDRSGHGRCSCDKQNFDVTIADIRAAKYG